MIWRRFAKRETEESFKGKPVVDLVFQFRVGINTKPLLEHQAFKEQQWREGSSAFAAGAHGVMVQ